MLNKHGSATTRKDLFNMASSVLLKMRDWTQSGFISILN